MVLPLLLALAAHPTVEWLDPALLQPQQQGVCVTEWGNGERIEIPVVVLGVLDASAPERSSILVRLADDRFVGSGVVAGMSGSPVYVEGKLLGAVAYGFAFAREGLAGITPFARMREIEAGAPAPPTSPVPLATLSGLAAARLAPDEVVAALAVARPGGPLPVAVGGLGASGGFAEQVLAAAGFRSLPAGGNAPVAGVPEAGDMVAALVVWGDAVVAAGGTVTARAGNTVWAFGHPLLSLGSVKFPAARARVVAIQDSYQVPFKVFCVGQPFGTFLADRPAGMLAEVGVPPAGVGVHIGVQGEGESKPRRWSFRMAEVPLLEPLLLTYLTAACLTARGAGTGEASVLAEFQFAFADGRTLTLRQAARGADALARTAAFAGAACAYFEASPFPHPPLASVQVRLDRTERPLGASIAEAIPARTVVAAGEQLDVLVRLRPHQASPVVRRLSVQVPADTQPGTLDLVVADGAAFSDYLVKAMGLEPTDFAGQLETAARLESSATLVVALEAREGGIAYPGASQPALPPSWAATLATGLGRQGPQRLKTTIVATTRSAAPYPLEGAFRIPLSVRRRPEGR